MKKRINKFKLGQVWIRTFGDKVVYKVISCQAGEVAYAEFNQKKCKNCTIRGMLYVKDAATRGYCCRLNINNPDIKKLTKLEALLENF
jgi:hypothetical protein